jgi:hypothetical protein
MIPFKLLRPFDKKSREMDRKIWRLWIALICTVAIGLFLQFSRTWSVASVFIGLKLGLRPEDALLARDIIPIAATALFALPIIAKIGGEARKFMEHYYKAKGKKNGRGR